MTFTIKITPRAQQDLKNIGRYTLQKWGKKKRDSYLRDLDRCFRWLAGNPKMVDTGLISKKATTVICEDHI